MVEAHNISVLAIEDSSNDLELLSFSLERAGIKFSLRSVDDPDALRAELTKNAPDVILSDNYLPKMDALEALQIARELRPETPFILFSGGAQPSKIEEVLRQGAKDYISKDELPRVIQLIHDLPKAI